MIVVDDGDNDETNDNFRADRVGCELVVRCGDDTHMRRVQMAVAHA